MPSASVRIMHCGSLDDPSDAVLVGRQTFPFFILVEAGGDCLAARACTFGNSNRHARDYTLIAAGQTTLPECRLSDPASIGWTQREYKSLSFRKGLGDWTARTLLCLLLEAGKPCHECAWEVHAAAGSD